MPAGLTLRSGHGCSPSVPWPCASRAVWTRRSPTAIAPWSSSSAPATPGSWPRCFRPGTWRWPGRIGPWSGSPWPTKRSDWPARQPHRSRSYGPVSGEPTHSGSWGTSPRPTPRSNGWPASLTRSATPSPPGISSAARQSGPCWWAAMSKPSRCRRRRPRSSPRTTSSPSSFTSHSCPPWTPIEASPPGSTPTEGCSRPDRR